MRMDGCWLVKWDAKHWSVQYKTQEVEQSFTFYLPSEVLTLSTIDFAIIYMFKPISCCCLVVDVFVLVHFFVDIEKREDTTYHLGWFFHYLCKNENKNKKDFKLSSFQDFMNNMNFWKEWKGSCWSDFKHIVFSTSNQSVFLKWTKTGEKKQHPFQLFFSQICQMHKCLIVQRTIKKRLIFKQNVHLIQIWQGSSGFDKERFGLNFAFYHGG